MPIQNIFGLPNGPTIKAGDPEYDVTVAKGPRHYIKAVHKVGAVASFAARLYGNEGQTENDYANSKVYEAAAGECVDTFDRITDGAFDKIFINAGIVRLEIASK